MSWKKHFRSVNNKSNSNLPNDRGYGLQGRTNPGQGGTTSKYASYLPEVYAGHPNRIQRYYQYDDMDRDSDINAALDTIADFCTQSEEQNDEPFEIIYHDKVTDTEIKLLKQYIEKWIKLNSFRSRLWHTFRNTLKNGDQLFLRDPETMEWMWVDTFMVEMVKVDESNGKKPEEYVIRGLDLNRQAKFATVAADPQQYRTPLGSSNAYGGRPAVVPASGGPSAFSLAGSNADPRSRQSLQGLNSQMFVVDAKHVVHLSLSVGMDINFPFGQSVLEPIFKTYKQKELLEDSVIIYRVQRAPERRVFKIDTGAMPPVRAKAYIEQVKNEIHQRRIPNRTGGGQSVLDAAYNPLCLDMNTEIPLLDGRTLTIRELSAEYKAGKENWIYSCDPISGKIVPGNVTWAGVTRENAKVIKITLDNEKTLTLTPDHKIPVLGKGFIEAQYLTIDDSLIAFNTRLKNIDRKLKNERTYEQVYNHSEKEWIYTHRMVGEFFRDLNNHQEFTFLPEHIDSVKQTIHHKDYNRYNNDPRNLQYMNKEDHRAYHVAMKQDYWDNITEEESARIKSKISKTLKSYYGNMSEEQKQALSDFAVVRSKRVHEEMKKNDPEKYNKWMSESADRIKEIFAPGTEAALHRGRRRVELGGKVLKNQELQVSQKLDRMIVDLVKEQNPSRIKAAELLSRNDSFLEELRSINPSQEGLINKIDYEKISPVKLDLIVEKLGYAGWRDLTRKIGNYNHRIVSIEWLDQPMQVGTITVDGKERWHKFHTFATKAGIFVKNSMIEDYFFACLSLNTGIFLLDGRKLTLSEIIKEYEEGKENWAFSLNTTTHKLEPGKISWAGITRKNAEIIRVTLDNGEFVDCTPDHKFILRDGSEIEAQFLTPNTSLMPLYLFESMSGKGQKKKKYTRYLCNSTGKKRFLHIDISNKPTGKDIVCHHKNLNSMDNSPTNLEIMTVHDHIELHKKLGSFSLGISWKDPIKRQNLLNGMKNLYANMSDQDRINLQERNRKNGANTFVKHKVKMIEHIKKISEISNKERTLLYSEDMFTRLIELYDSGYDSISKLIPVLKNDQEFQNCFKKANENTKQFSHHGVVGSFVSDKTLNKIVQVAGYKSWNEFKTLYKKNHKVVSVEVLSYREDTGDITIESPSNSHVFALTAGVYVHNCGNEGRGSSVEVLPGGDQTGDITDLSFFSKKLARGLRIPPSYLSIGDDANGAVSFNDGKLGAALIQEFRFNKYCMRMQSLLSPIFDKEFKYYLEKNGIEIDSNIFELRFNPPQNFTKYRQIELDTQQMQVYTQIQDNKKLSERFKLKRFLNLTEEELIENEAMWVDENPEIVENSTGQNPADMNTNQDLSDVGVRGGGMGDDMGLDALGNEPEGDASSEGGPEGGPPPGGPGGPGGAPGGDAGAPPPPPPAG